MPRVVFRYYPYVIQYAEVKLELTSCSRLRKDDAGKDEMEPEEADEMGEGGNAAAPAAAPISPKLSRMQSFRKVSRNVMQLKRLYDNAASTQQ